MKLDIGCGKRKQEGYFGIDVRPFEGVDLVMDVCARYEGGNGPFREWPWKDGEIDEIYCSHFLEHLTGEQRIHFVNEAYRVLKPGGMLKIIVPHWNSGRAYGDLTHQWPPVVEMWTYYLSADWRKDNAPHNDTYTCDFSAEWGYGLRTDLLSRNQEFVQFALTNYKEAAQDLHINAIALK